MRPSNISFLQFSSQRQLIFLLLFCFIILSILSFDVSSALQGASEVETDLIEDDQIVVPWKKLYRPRGPPRFGKRGLILMNRHNNYQE